MPRYHFHSSDGTVVRDEQGEELPDITAAQDVALSVLSEVLPTKRNTFWDSRRFSINVKDETGRLVLVLSATATVDLMGRPDEPPLS
jgi:hypothetical protein